MASDPDCAAELKCTTQRFQKKRRLCDEDVKSHEKPTDINSNINRLVTVCGQKMLRVREEEMRQSGGRGRGLPRRGAGYQTEEDEDDEEEEEGFSESELELYEQYKAAGYRDLVSDPSAGSTGTCCGLMMRLAIAGVAQRGGGRAVGLSEEEGGEGETCEEKREEDGEEGENIGSFHFRQVCSSPGPDACSRSASH